MLTGTADPEALATAAPRMTTLAAAPVRLGGVEVLQAAFELPYACREPLLPPGLHPTTPPLLVLLAWQVAESPWGAFALAQARVSCRSGVRPRGLVTRCVADNPDAVTALAGDWGLPAGLGAVALRRGYDRVELHVARDGAPVLDLVASAPDPLRPGDAQFTVTTTLARTPKGLRLVQLEPEYELDRVERVRPRLDAFHGEAWGLHGVVPRAPVAAVVGVGGIVIPSVRFVSRPDVNAFEGTEPA
ncbi:MAG TPA: hypothetical protein VMU14_12185 [Acidimicrobiales bacterium]|nr:hypothetical protein [Acidimicrobiales bacterium]